MTDIKDYISRLKEALQVIDLQRKILSDARADDLLVKDLSALVRYLQSMSNSQASHILEKTHRRSTEQKKTYHDAIAQVYNLGLDEVLRIINSDDVTRAELESIAVGRFQVPKGSLRSFGNMDQLKSKVNDLIQNERSHQTISKLASEHKFK